MELSEKINQLVSSYVYELGAVRVAVEDLEKMAIRAWELERSHPTSTVIITSLPDTLEEIYQIRRSLSQSITKSMRAHIGEVIPDGIESVIK